MHSFIFSTLFSTLFSLAFAHHTPPSTHLRRADPINNAASIQDYIPVEKIYGLNLGSWLVFEPWMSHYEWLEMGGECCDDCMTCRSSEWALAKHLGQDQTDAVFLKHWKTWFTDADVQEIKGFGINTVRIPLGFWLIEGIVHREDEPYPRGGLNELIRGLESLKAAGIHVILSHHALPGVASKKQGFAGNCTLVTNFYEEANYKRAATWTAAMTFLTHVHPAFETVFALQAINEPEMNYALTPGYEQYQKSFVLTVRAIECSLGIACDPRVASEAPLDPIARAALAEVVPILVDFGKKYNWNLPFGISGTPFVTPSGLPPAGSLSSLLGGRNRKSISTNFMKRDWQWSSDPSKPVPNPADVARGPQIYDKHLYFSFGGAADANPDAYIKAMCNMMHTEEASSDTPYFYGEWSLGTEFIPTDDFLRKWGDAQKAVFESKSAGWIFWNWKVISVDDKSRTWSYRDAVGNGTLTRDAADMFDPSICGGNRVKKLNPHAHPTTSGAPTPSGTTPATNQSVRKMWPWLGGPIIGLITRELLELAQMVL